LRSKKKNAPIADRKSSATTIFPVIEDVADVSAVMALSSGSIETLRHTSYSGAAAVDIGEIPRCGSEAPMHAVSRTLT
jgi:hypothetical protein